MERIPKYCVGIYAMVVVSYSSVIVSDHADNATTLHTVELAFIVPLDTSRLFCWDRIQPAIDIVLDKIYTTQLLTNTHLSIRHADSKCNSAAAPLAAFELFHREQAQVFIGPVCDYSLAPVARYSPYWNVPVITPGGMAHDFGENKRIANAEYALLTRVGWTFDSLAEFIYYTILHYKWSSVKLLYNSTGHSEVGPNFCFLSISAVISKLRVMATLDFHLYLFNNNKNLTEEIPKMLTEEISTRYSGLGFSRLDCFVRLVINTCIWP